MKPLKPKKSIEGINRAKMYIKRDLDFLIGYPTGDGNWISHPEGVEIEVITITRDYIQKATFTINKLVKDFPKALPKLVGDVEKWSGKYKNMLEILKETIHNDKPFIDSLVKFNPECKDAEIKLYKKMRRENPLLIHV